MDAAGAVLTPLDLAEVEPSWPHRSGADVDAVAVCLLHSYVNDAHEQAIARADTPRFPRLAVSHLVRHRARDPRIRAHVDDRRERLRAAADHRAYLDRARRSGAARSGLRRAAAASCCRAAASRRARRRPIRRYCCSNPAPPAACCRRSTPRAIDRHRYPRVRHGRHDRQSLRRDRRGDRCRAQLRSRARASRFKRGSGLRSSIAEHRLDRNRRGRRHIARVERARPAQRRARQRRRRSRVRPAMGAAARNRPSPTPISCSAISIPTIFSAAR